MIKSPLRYPGGKSRVVSKLVDFLPENISEYREPMVGGGSLFIYIRQIFPDIKVSINDLNRNVYCFWKVAKENNSELVEEIKRIKKNNKNGKKLFENLKSQIENDQISDFERAVNFFILNRISFSGLTTSGGFSKDAFKKRFTMSSIERLSDLELILQNVGISYGDYSNLLNSRKEDVIIYLDPPYFKNKNSKLYGKNGDLHLNFDHDKFYEDIVTCKHNLLISYDNSTKNVKKFHITKKFFISSINIQYGMNNISKSRIPKKNELIITNYRISKNTKQNLMNNQCGFHNLLKNDIFFSIINEIDKNVGHWKKVSTLRKNIFNKNDFKTSISEQDFKKFFKNLIHFLKIEKFLDLKMRKGCGKILFKSYKWDLDRINDLILYI